MVHVIKRSGKKQAFMPSKLRRSVEKAAKEAGISSGKIKILVNEVVDPFINITKKKRVVKAVEIRKSVLRRIERRMKSVASAWRRHEKKKRK